MDVVAVIYQILMMLMIAAVGFWLRKKDVLTVPVIKGISFIVLKVAMPAMILMLTQRNVAADLRGNFLKIALSSLLLISTSGLGVYWLVKRSMSAHRAPVYAALAAMPNSGYMGLPVIQALYGDIGALYLAAFLIGFNLTIYTMLERIMGGKGTKITQVFVNIGVVASLTGLDFYLFSIRLPAPIVSFLTQLGGLTTPLSMLLAGARMAEFRFDALKDRTLWSAIGLRLLAFPLLSWLLFSALGFTGVELGVMTLASAMPCAVAGQMYAERFDKDAVFAATGVSISTVLCLISIPLIAWITGA